MNRLGAMAHAMTKAAHSARVEQEIIWIAEAIQSEKFYGAGGNSHPLGLVQQDVEMPSEAACDTCLGTADSEPVAK